MKGRSQERSFFVCYNSINKAKGMKTGVSMPFIQPNLTT